MLFQKKILFRFAVFIALLSCNNNEYINGQQRSSVDTINGTYKTYYFDGKVETISQFENGKLAGEQVRFYPSGNTECKFYYVNGIPNGSAVGYHDEKGLISWKGQYVNGEMDSIWFYYGERGTIIGVKSYYDGKELPAAQ